MIQRYLYQMNCCAYCKRKLTSSAQIDHVSPICRTKNKRVNQYANLVISCATCNRLKGIQANVVYPIWVAERRSKFRKVEYKKLLEMAEQMRR